MTVFYRKYRPQKLADLIGQDHVRDTLLAQLESGKIGHGYLFSGPRGSGKTSTARILAKAVNCRVYGLRSTDYSKKSSRVSFSGEKRKSVVSSQKYGEPCNKCHACLGITDGSYLDLIEIDAASNRGIDEIRDLREKIKLAPAAGRFKVYIIDEAQMLTPEAFNALLKTLEEPPAHAIFILCTTAPGKIPATIVSRLSRFNFKKAKAEDLIAAIEKIAKKEGIKIEAGADGAIAKAADGSFRDAVSILDQLASASVKVSEADVKAFFKLSGTKALYDLISKVFKGDLKASVLAVEEIGAAGDIATFTRDAILLLKKLLFIKIGVEVEDDNLDDLNELAQQASYSQIQNLMKLFFIAEGEIKYYPQPEIALTLAICKFLPSFVESDSTSEGRPEVEEEAGSVAKNQLSVVSSRLSDEGKSVSQPSSLKTDEPKAGKQESEDRKQKTDNRTLSASAKNLAEVEAKWGEFLAKVKPVNAHVVALLRSTRPTGFDGVTLILEVFFKFHKEKLEEPRIMDLVSSTLEEVLGKPVSLKLVLADRETRPPKTVTVSDVAEIGDDELSKMAAEIFSK
ncbi:DNA polymerase III subunit gamma/tau [Candidatus Curtissbacteria bacterium]|nr:DNA polymerase III subunit gamma/tau [Candidatus Curtissbacteria bacterium]